MTKRCSALLIVLRMALAAVAQQDASFAHYWAMESSFNPASVGKEAKLNVAGAYAMQLTGFEHAPRTMYVAADLPFYALNRYHGAGVQLINDQIGLFTHQRLGLQYAFQPRLAGGRLSLGVQVSALSEKFDGTRLEAADANDPALPSAAVDGTALDLGAGLYYLHRRWYAGVSATHLNAPRVALGDTYELAIAATYYFTGGYNIQLRHPFLTVRTSLLGRTDGTAWRADLTGRLVYEHEKRYLYAGLTYSPDRSVTVLVGGRWRGVHIGYSYEAYTSAVSFGNGSHELFVGYQTELDLRGKRRNLHKSVRIL